MSHPPERWKLQLIAVYGQTAANAGQPPDLRRLDSGFMERTKPWLS
ncbi:hypothetical protein [Streptomyces capitiformicae]|nr:hypothetical protein [Streptomyces capitiformicae]